MGQPLIGDDGTVHKRGSKFGSSKQNVMTPDVPVDQKPFQSNPTANAAAAVSADPKIIGVFSFNPVCRQPLLTLPTTEVHW